MYYLERLIRKYPDLVSCKSDIQIAFEHICSSYNNGGKLLLCGNGGSAADCDHIVGELMKSFMNSRKLSDKLVNQFKERFPDDGAYIAERIQGALPAVSLVSASSFWSAYANDVDAEFIFAQQVYGLGNINDVLLCLSTSGNSKNVVRAVQVAKIKGIRTIGLTGKSGGRLADLCDVVIKVPYEETIDIQERHLPIYHALCLMLEDNFFGHNI